MAAVANNWLTFARRMPSRLARLGQRTWVAFRCYHRSIRHVDGLGLLGLTSSAVRLGFMPPPLGKWSTLPVAAANTGRHVSQPVSILVFGGSNGVRFLSAGPAGLLLRFSAFGWFRLEMFSRTAGPALPEECWRLRLTSSCIIVGERVLR